MKLQEIFDQLSYGELSQLNIGGGDGGILAANYPRILSHINLGLNALYKRFNLKEGRLVVQLVDAMTLYPINSDFAASNRRSRQTNKFILDSTVLPFEDDILKIERVYTDAKVELVLNDLSYEYSLFTPSTYLLQVPSAMVDGDVDLPDYLKTVTLEVVYRAEHKPIVVTAGFFDPTRVLVDLPSSYLEPLLLFVASRINNPIGMTNEFHAGNNYAAKYEKACQQLELVNLQVDRGSQSSGISRNGWV